MKNFVSKFRYYRIQSDAEGFMFQAYWGNFPGVIKFS